MDYKKEIKAIVGQVVPPVKVCYTWEEFKKRFKKMGKFMAVADWRWGENDEDGVKGKYLIVIIFSNNRKLRYACDDMKCLDPLYDLIQGNKLKHNS